MKSSYTFIELSRMVIDRRRASKDRLKSALAVKSATAHQPLRQRGHERLPIAALRGRRRLVLLAALLALLPGMFGCGDGSTVHIRRWPDGSPHESKEVIPGPNGKWLNHGKYTVWYANGNKQEEGHYDHGNLHGLVTHWYENGVKKAEGHWENGRALDDWTLWDQDGNPTSDLPPEHESLP